jgi:hypothetical protein
MKHHRDIITTEGMPDNVVAVAVLALRLRSEPALALW